MTLLEFLRKSNAQGDVVEWVRKNHAAAGAAESLEEFARACPGLRGEDHRRGDGQPVQRQILRAVAPAAAALPAGCGTRPSGCARDAYIANVLALVSAQRAIVDQYLSGKLTAADEVPEPQFGRPPAGPRSEGEPERPEFNRMQQVLEQAALKRINLLLDFQDARDGETAERLDGEQPAVLHG